jgi:hypothetical protein
MTRLGLLWKLVWAGLLLATSTTTPAGDSFLQLTLHEQFLNRLAAAALPYSSSQRYQGEIGMGIAAQPWTMETRFTVEALRTTVRDQDIGIEARVRVEAAGLDYTHIARGTLQPFIQDGKLIMEVRHLSLPLQLRPFGFPVELGAVPAEHFLPQALRTIEMDLSSLAIPVELPGDGESSIRITGARIETRPPHLIVHASLTP